MNSSPSTSGISPENIYKRSKIGFLTVDEKQSIVKMYNDYRAQNMNAVTIVNKISISQGIAKSTVYRTIKQYKQNGFVSESKHTGGRPNFANMYDDYTTNAVREIIRGFVKIDVIPSVNEIWKEVQSRQDLPQMTHLSLYTFIKRMHFNFVSDNVIMKKQWHKEMETKNSATKNAIPNFETVLIKEEPVEDNLYAKDDKKNISNHFEGPTTGKQNIAKENGDVNIKDLHHEIVIKSEYFEDPTEKQKQAVVKDKSGDIKQEPLNHEIDIKSEFDDF